MIIVLVFDDGNSVNVIAEISDQSTENIPRTGLKTPDLVLMINVV